MTRGTIVSLTPVRVLPTFSYACEYNPTFLRLYSAHLRTLGFTVFWPGWVMCSQPLPGLDRYMPTRPPHLL